MGGETGYVNEGRESLTPPQEAGVPGAKRKQQCRILYPPRAHDIGGAKVAFLENKDEARCLKIPIEKSDFCATDVRRSDQPVSIRCRVFTFRDCQTVTLLHDALGVSDRADAQAEFAAKSRNFEMDPRQPCFYFRRDRFSDPAERGSGKNGFRQEPHASWCSVRDAHGC